MKKYFSQKNKNLFAKTLVLILLLGFSFGNAGIVIAQQGVNDGFQYPKEEEGYSVYERESFYPIPAIGESGLASSTKNEIFEKYGELYVDWVNMRTADWEQNRLSCAEDIHDFLYNYMKDGDGNTPGYTWSRLLQPNGFQSRTGAWNDFDGDGLINGIVRSNQESLPPQSIDNNSNGSVQDEWDDFYGNGIPNKFDPFVENYGFTSIEEMMSALGTSVDDDVDNDGKPNTADESPFFATFGDADFSGNDLGKQDIYFGLRDLDNQGKTNEKLEQELVDMLNDTFGLGEDYKTNISSGNADESVDVEGGALVDLAINQDKSLLQIRNLTANTAYSAEQIYKQMVNNCVILSEISDTLARQEYKELVSDASAREIAQKKQEQLRNQTYKAVTAGFNPGIDINQDGEIDEKDNQPNIGDLEQNISTAVTAEQKIFFDEFSSIDNDYKDIIEASVLSIKTSGQLNDYNKTLTEKEKAAYYLGTSNEDQSNNNLSKKNGGFFSKIGSYFLSAVGGASVPTGNSGGSMAEFSVNYWSALEKKFGLGPDNPFVLFTNTSSDLDRRQEMAEQNTREQILAGDGFLPERICVVETSDGSACREWATITPGSSVKEIYNRNLTDQAEKNTNTHEQSDL